MSCFQQQYMPASNIWLLSLSLSLSLSCIDATEKTLYPYLLRMWVTTIMLCCASVHMTALHQYHHKNTTNAIYLGRLTQLDCHKNTTRIQHTSMQYFKQVPRIHPDTFLCYCQISYSPQAVPDLHIMNAVSSPRSISVSFLIRTSGKEYHFQAGLTILSRSYALKQLCYIRLSLYMAFAHFLLGLQERNIYERNLNCN